MNRGSEEAANAKRKGAEPNRAERAETGSRKNGAGREENRTEALPETERIPRLADKGGLPQEASDPREREPARTRFFIGPLLEETEAARLVTEEDRQQAAAFASARRRREFLSWRAFLYRELGTPVGIAYEASGAPRLTNRTLLPLHIGVSHCRTHAAVCWSESRCAMDIELIGRNFEKVRSRYLSPGEESLCTRPDWLCIAWCAKECLYKLAGEQGLDLLRDLHLHAASFFDKPQPQPGAFDAPHPGAGTAPSAQSLRPAGDELYPTENYASEAYRTDDRQPLLTLGTLRGSIHNRPVTLRILSLGPVRIVLSE